MLFRSLLFARGERKGFHLPGGDGTVILAAGAWAALLLLWRVFDRPDVEGRGATVGITWGFFFAFVAAATLATLGWRVRAAGRPEPPIVREDDDATDYGPRTASPPTAATQVAPRRRRPAAPAAPVAEQLTLEDVPPPTAATREERPAPPEPPREERSGSLWSDDEPEREEPPAPQREERPAPPPLRPGVFDQTADDD